MGRKSPAISPNIRFSQLQYPIASPSGTATNTARRYPPNTRTKLTVTLPTREPMFSRFSVGWSRSDSTSPICGRTTGLSIRRDA